ncbi:MAG: YqiA/YcfP family alpha/beta fold hydrolase [Burkholderiaceae bacterium]
MAKEPVTHLLYLHGFRSSPQSTKARVMAAWVQEHRPDVTWWCPQLPPSPLDAMQMLFEGIAAWPAAQTGVVGSSLGGFYATAAAERLGCRAVLLNPAIEPARDLAKYIGETTAWHSDEKFFFRPEFIDELRAIAPGELTQLERYFAVISKGDEVLDWREMSARYKGCRIKLLEGSDHALTEFEEEHLPEVLAFLGLAVTSG